MPYRDGTGPEGNGAMTGRSAGNCTGRTSTGIFAPLRRWFGRAVRGSGQGRGASLNRRNSRIGR